LEGPDWNGRTWHAWTKQMETLPAARVQRQSATCPTEGQGSKGGSALMQESQERDSKCIRLYTVRYGTVVNQRQRRESETRSSFTWFPAGCACTENSARIALRQNYRCSVLDDLGGARSAKRSSFPAGCAPKHSSGRAPRAELPQRRRKSRRQEVQGQSKLAIRQQGQVYRLDDAESSSRKC
jgi:hemin uptake protein HemP